MKPTMTKPAIILFAHGARDPRWAEPLQAVAAEICRLDPDAQVSLAFLELMSPTLPDLVRQLVAQGFTEARLLPVFLGGAGHVLRDLPALVEACRQHSPDFRIEVAPSVGQQRSVIQAIAQLALAGRQ